MASASTSPAASQRDEQGMMNDVAAFSKSCNTASKLKVEL
jgi:hypothetical protein